MHRRLRSARAGGHAGPRSCRAPWSATRRRSASCRGAACGTPGPPRRCARSGCRGRKHLVHGSSTSPPARPTGCGRRADHSLHALRIDPVVGLHHLAVLALRRDAGERAVVVGHLRHVRLAVDEAYARIPARVRLRDLEGAVRAAVVDQHVLELAVRLREDALDALGEVGFGVSKGVTTLTRGALISASPVEGRDHIGFGLRRSPRGSSHAAYLAHLYYPGAAWRIPRRGRPGPGGECRGSRPLGRTCPSASSPCVRTRSPAPARSRGARE